MNRHRTLSAMMSLAALAFLAACSSGSKDAVDTAAVTADTSAAPSMADTSMSPVTSTTTPAASSTASTGTITKININTATDAQILAIPGMGPRMLREFKEYRPYTSIEQFRREIGKYVDKAEVARLEQYITIK